MTVYLLPVLFALFLWWFSTGVIIYLDGLPKRTFRWSMLTATLVLAAAVYGLASSVNDPSPAGAYLAFACGLLIWGWLEISFYMGYVTGPRRHACAPGCRGWRHFGHALQVSLYHEIAIVILGGLIVAISWGAANQVGLWTFLVLAWMHESARLNVFLGVRNLNKEFVPEHMHYLQSFLRKRPMNLLFPFSVTLSTVALVLLIQQAAAPGADAFSVVAYCLVASIMALAILEHWFLVVPLPSAQLWHWGLRSRSAPEYPLPRRSDGQAVEATAHPSQGGPLP